MNILQITTNYAPRGASSAIRTTNISKYLSQLGVIVHVITYDVDTLLLFSAADDYLSQKVQDVTSITRLPGGFLKRMILKTTSSRANANSLKAVGPFRAATSILVPDPHVDGLLKFYRRSRKILKETNADVILTHGYPFTMHIVGYLLKIKNPGVRWIADYGDPWTGSPISELPRPKWRKWLDFRIERRLLQRADLVTMTTVPSMLLYEKYFDFLRGKIHLVPMGFDPDDFVDSLPPIPAKKNTKSVRLVHTGRLYSEARNPEPFIIAMEELIDRIPGFTNLIEIVLVGSVEEKIKHRIKHSTAGRLFTFVEWVPFLESLAWMKGADYLLLFGNSGNIQIPGKVYQYIGAEKPILVLIDSTDDPTIDVIRDSEALIVDNKVSVIRSVVARLVKNPTAFTGGPTAASKYAWPTIVSALLKRVSEMPSSISGTN